MYRNDTGECISRPFPKFFNIGEIPETKLENLDLTGARFYTKFDGSLIHLVNFNKERFIECKSKSSFFSKVANECRQSFNFKYEDLCNDPDITHLFEYVSQDNRIVLNYDNPDLIYLGYRSISTGKTVLNDLHLNNNIKYEDVLSRTDIEGFVIQLNDGTLVKAKTKWYVERHSYCTSFSDKHWVKTIQNNTFDDIISIVRELNVPEVESRACKLKTDIDNEISDIVKIAINHYVTIRSFLDHDLSDRGKYARIVNDVVDQSIRSLMFILYEDKDDYRRLYTTAKKLVTNRYLTRK